MPLRRTDQNRRARIAHGLLSGEMSFEEYRQSLDPEKRLAGDLRLLAALADISPPEKHKRIPVSGSGLAPLTDRQVEILGCAANGMTSRETAETLGLSTETVKTHRSRILALLDARNLTHAVAIWQARGV